MNNKKIKILMIEDSVDDAALIKRRLENSTRARFSITAAKTLDEGLKYLTRQIIEARGGRIWAESKIGKGSTFSFALPLNGRGRSNHE